MDKHAARQELTLKVQEAWAILTSAPRLAMHLEDEALADRLAAARDQLRDILRAQEPLL